MIATILGPLIGQFLPYLLGGIALIGVVLGVRNSGRRDQQAADLSKQARETERAHDAAVEVDRLSDDAVRNELHTDWSRQ